MDNSCMSIINIFAILLSPLIATGVTLYFTHKNDKRKEKLVIFEKLMTTRLNRSTIEYVHALNLIDVVFYDNNNVRDELKKLLKAYHSEKSDNNEINIRNLKLVEAIAKDLGYDKISWEDISKPYAPIWYYDELENQEKYKCGQLAIADLAKALVASQNNNKIESQDTK